MVKEMNSHTLNLRSTTLKTTHGKFKCTQRDCEKSYTRQYRLRQHVEQAHLQRGMVYECPVCHKTSHDKQNIIVHHRTHTGEKPYSCRYCNKTFAVQGNKNDHERRHLRRKYILFLLCYCAYLGLTSASTAPNHSTGKVREITTHQSYILTYKLKRKLNMKLDNTSRGLRENFQI